MGVRAVVGLLLGNCRAIQKSLLERKIDPRAHSRKIDQSRTTCPCTTETGVSPIPFAAHYKRRFSNTRIQLETCAQRAITTQPKVSGVEIGCLQEIACRRKKISGVLLIITQTRHESDRAFKGFVQR